MKYHGLGKGLGALISNRNINTATPSGKLEGAIFYIEISKIYPNPDQPRREFDDDQLNELADSIRDYGILQPLVVSKIEQITQSGIDVKYQLIAGERRLRASKLAGLLEVPIIIRKVAPKENLEIAIIENVQRADLNAIERGAAYQRLMDEYGLSQQEVASRVGKSRESIANVIRLLNLPEEIKSSLCVGKINEGHARAILAIKDAKDQMDLFYKIINMGLNVREVENIARMTRNSPRAVFILDADTKSLVSQLEESLGTKVKITPTAKGGKIMIEYYNQDDLENIVVKICGPGSAVFEQDQFSGENLS